MSGAGAPPAARPPGALRLGLRACLWACVWGGLSGAGCVAPPDGAGPGQAARSPDADADGVGDADDACPASRTRRAIDARGCSALDGPIRGLSFRPGRAELGRAARRAIDPVVAALLEAPDAVVALEGHTDNRGSAAENLALSKRRVMAVVRYLVTRGVAPERLRPAGFGEGRPVAPNATAAGREANRRIEVRVLESAPVPGGA